MKKILKAPLKGDTLIEVMLAVAIFGLGSIGAISLMNKGLATAENTLETTMARQEIDTQAEALRFIHGAYLGTHNDDTSETSDDVYVQLWRKLTTNAYKYRSAGTAASSLDDGFFDYHVEPGSTCAELFETLPAKSFVVNTRLLNTDNLADALVYNNAHPNTLIHASTYPRLRFDDLGSDADDENLSDAGENETGTKIVLSGNTNLTAAEGIWVTAVESESRKQGTDEPDYYDFHIRTCWDAVGGNSASVITSTVRLFNPDQVSLVNPAPEVSIETEADPPPVGDLPSDLEHSSIFFVLTWTGSNSDIDSHLTGENIPVGGCYSYSRAIYYGCKTAGEEISVEGTTTYQFNLDVDALNSHNYSSSSDSNCGYGCGDGFIEVTAMRNIIPGTYHFSAHDYPGTVANGLRGQNLIIRVYTGFASAGVGMFPREAQPVATFVADEIISDSAVKKYWYVCDVTIDEGGHVTVEGHNNIGSSHF